MSEHYDYINKDGETVSLNHREFLLLSSRAEQQAWICRKLGFNNMDELNETHTRVSMFSEKSRDCIDDVIAPSDEWDPDGEDKKGGPGVIAA